MAGRGEAASEVVSDEAALARDAQTDCGVDDLLGEALTKQVIATNGYGTGCGPCNSSSGVAGRACSASCAAWAPTLDLAARIAGNARSYWRNSAMGLNRVMPIACFDRLGVPRFS